MQKAHSNQLNLEWITNPALEKLVKSLSKSKKINLFNPNVSMFETVARDIYGSFLLTITARPLKKDTD
ncbi:hypothetical protein [Limosilactobacillus reuteri]|uniref:hypothetical protein n=1 Tax=Limosilactobacillus reuteri TaxID=1598 RepID=UPI001E64B0C0|nr:hypothetical protein [Limosilactobacillus reuteri]MCC4444673.1 hypothetical protein [Limosilactobacillus reuteri]